MFSFLSQLQPNPLPLPLPPPPPVECTQKTCQKGGVFSGGQPPTIILCTCDKNCRVCFPQILTFSFAVYDLPI